MSSVLAAAPALTGGEQVAFWILAPLALGGAIGMVLSRNAIHAALMLVNTMLSLGVFYLINGAPFVGMVQIIVYTGAIMILFLFVLMLVGRDASDSLVEILRGQRLAGALLGVGLALLVATGVARAFVDVEPQGFPTVAEDGNVPALAQLLFTRYVFAFEVTSALLITAAVGAMVLTHVREGGLPTQRERSRARFIEGNYPAPRPGPGVYATSDSVATPALLPDGTLAQESVASAAETKDLSPRALEAKG